MKLTAKRRFNGFAAAICILLLFGILGSTACPGILDDGGADVPFENTVWILERYGQLGNMKSVLLGIRVTAVFVGSEKKVHGSSGCNNYGGDYRIIDPGTPFEGGLEMGRLLTTLITCGEAVDKQATAYFEILASATSYKVEGRTLTITGSKGILVYKP